MIDIRALLSDSTLRRPYTRQLIKAIEERQLTKDEAIAMFIDYLTDQDVGCVLRDNDVIKDSF